MNVNDHLPEDARRLTILIIALWVEILRKLSLLFNIYRVYFKSMSKINEVISSAVLASKTVINRGHEVTALQGRGRYSFLKV